MTFLGNSTAACINKGNMLKHANVHFYSSIERHQSVVGADHKPNITMHIVLHSLQVPVLLFVNLLLGPFLYHSSTLLQLRHIL